MYNTERPSADELPSTKQLVRSTIIAIVSALVILITIVLPSEYGIDPTGIGKAVGLAEMGEIRQQLQREAEDDHHGAIEKPISLFAGLFISNAYAEEPWKDEVTFTLDVGEGYELKLAMEKGAKAEYSWTSENGRANYDLHAHGGGNSASYKKGRGVTADNGVLEAEFTGNHGWFWRNRDKQPITIILRVRGEYTDVKK